MQKSFKLQIVTGRSRRLNGRWASRREKNFILVIFATLFFMSLLSWNSFEDTKLHSMLYPEVLFSQPVPEVRAVDGEIETPSSSAPQIEPSIEDRIRMRFQEKGDMMVAIARPESGLNPRAMGWNCYYNGRSQACKKGDRDKAWSVDCGVFQINVSGQVCPEDHFDVNTNLELAYGKLQRQGFNAWSVYKSGIYKQYLGK